MLWFILMIEQSHNAQPVYPKYITILRQKNTDRFGVVALVFLVIIILFMIKTNQYWWCTRFLLFPIQISFFIWSYRYGAKLSELKKRDSAIWDSQIASNINFRVISEFDRGECASAHGMTLLKSLLKIILPEDNFALDNEDNEDVGIDLHDDNLWIAFLNPDEATTRILTTLRKSLTTATPMVSMLEQPIPFFLVLSSHQPLILSRNVHSYVGSVGCCQSYFQAHNPTWNLTTVNTSPEAIQIP